MCITPWTRGLCPPQLRVDAHLLLYEHKWLLHETVDHYVRVSWGVFVPTLVRRHRFFVPIWLSLSFSEIFFPVSQRNSLPEHAPIPGSSSEAVLVSSTLGLDGELLAMDGVDERHRAHRSDRVGVGPCIQNTLGGVGGGHARKKKTGKYRQQCQRQHKDMGRQRPGQSRTQWGGDKHNRDEY